MPAPWLLAAAWAWLALAAFAVCLSDRFRHRLPAAVRSRVAGIAGLALLPAAVLAVWAWRQPVGGPPAGGPAMLLWQGMAFVVTVLAIAAGTCLLGGSIYLAFGRLMGTRACSACGWQAMIVERLPEVAVAAAVTAIGMAVFRGSVLQGDRAWVTGLLLIVQLGIVWWWLTLLRSVLMAMQPAFMRTGLVWFGLFLVGRIGWRCCQDVVAGDTVAAGWLAGATCGVALVVLAAALHRQAILLGLRFDRPAALAEIVGGLSPLRRLAACALGGLMLAGGCGYRLVLLRAGDAANATPGLLIVAVAILWLLVTWGAALVRDRLGPACSPSISAGTVTLLLGSGSIGSTIGGGFDPGSSAVEQVLFLASLAIVAVGIGWCSLAAWRPGRQPG